MKRKTDQHDISTKKGKRTKNKKDYSLISCKVSPSFGNFSHCLYRGCVLTEEENSFHSQILLSVELYLSDDLFLDTNCIMVFHGKQCITLTSYEIKPMTSIRFTVPESCIGQEISFYFQTCMYSESVLFKHTIIIPPVEILGEKENCTICLEPIKEKNKYVSECQHLFCLSCIFTYLDHKGFIEKCDCNGNDDHNYILNCVQCPTCKKTIHEGCY
jgi:hypothetical protein